MHEKTLDCAGLSCPLPIVKTSQAMKHLAAGERLRVIATDPGARNDIKAWAVRTGNRLVSLEDVGGTLTFLLEKGG